jgi:hypothetical protein
MEWLWRLSDRIRRRRSAAGFSGTMLVVVVVAGTPVPLIELTGSVIVPRVFGLLAGLWITVKCDLILTTVG